MPVYVDPLSDYQMPRVEMSVVGERTEQAGIRLLRDAQPEPGQQIDFRVLTNCRVTQAIYKHLPWWCWMTAHDAFELVETLDDDSDFSKDSFKLTLWRLGKQGKVFTRVIVPSSTSWTRGQPAIFQYRAFQPLPTTEFISYLQDQAAKRQQHKEFWNDWFHGVSSRARGRVGTVSSGSLT